MNFIKCNACALHVRRRRNAYAPQCVTETETETETVNPPSCGTENIYYSGIRARVAA